MYVALDKSVFFVIECKRKSRNVAAFCHIWQLQKKNKSHWKDEGEDTTPSKFWEYKEKNVGVKLEAAVTQIL